jgi:hypothetical protein
MVLTANSHELSLQIMCHFFEGSDYEYFRINDNLICELVCIDRYMSCRILITE